MFVSGLASVSFRQLNTDEIIALAARTGIEQIEWGADVHILPGQTEKAKEIRKKCTERGIKTTTYGSYFRIGRTPDEDISSVLESATALGASVVRVWGYDQFITPSNAGEWDMAVGSAMRAAKIADEYGIKLALECHMKTITESAENALQFINEVGSETLGSYWQPNHHRDTAYNESALKMLLPHLEAVHVFNWDKCGRYPLEEGIETWRSYLDIAKVNADTRDLPLLLEFMPDGRAESLMREAMSLRGLILAYR